MWAHSHKSFWIPASASPIQLKMSFLPSFVLGCGHIGTAVAKYTLFQGCWHRAEAWQAGPDSAIVPKLDSTVPSRARLVFRRPIDPLLQFLLRLLFSMQRSLYSLEICQQDPSSPLEPRQSILAALYLVKNLNQCFFLDVFVWHDMLWLLIHV